VTRPVEPTLVTDQVFDSIRDSIMSGELAAGTRLRLRPLAAQLGTSPMPVRDAILRLEQIGLVRRLPHRGAVVADLTTRELADIYATRLVLEVEATRTGSGVLSEDDSARMRALHDRMIEAVHAGRLVDALDHDEALLTVLYTAGGNPVMLGIIHDLWRRCRPYKIANVQRSSEIGDLTVWAFQGPLIDAASVHDVDAATAVTHQSLISSSERLRSLLATEAAQPDGR
jgi:DNA-binding GntR family transcriptional regulator